MSKGHNAPSLPEASMGEVVTLFVRGLNVPAARSELLPLSAELAGVRVTARDPFGLVDTALPIFSVQPLACDAGRSDLCNLTAVTVQFPTGFQRCLPVGAPIFDPCVSRLTIAVEAAGLVPEEVEYGLTGSTIHLLSSCDVTLQGFYSLPNELLGLCVSVVMKADGSLVSGVNPVRPGETVTLFAVGLGLTSNDAPAGSPTPAGISFDPSLFYLSFDSRWDGVAQPPYTDDPRIIPAVADYVGLVPGAVGIYQINVRLPEEFPVVLSPCSGLAGSSNVTITLGASHSRDTARICVQLP